MSDDVERPSRYSEEVNREVARALLPHVLRWLEARGEGDMSDDEVSDVLRQLEEACDTNDDGYQIARELDNRHTWEVDSELVDVLGSVAFERVKVQERLVEAWAVQRGVTPKHSVGQRVSFKQRRCDKEQVVGEVTAVKERTAQYLVFCESLGHVRKGVGTHGVYVPFEEVESA